MRVVVYRDDKPGKGFNEAELAMGMAIQALVVSITTVAIPYIYRTVKAKYDNRKKK